MNNMAESKALHLRASHNRQYALKQNDTSYIQLGQGTMQGYVVDYKETVMIMITITLVYFSMITIMITITYSKSFER